jgi:hypothetical protein
VNETSDLCRAGTETTERSVLQAFLDELSTRLHDGQGLPGTSAERVQQGDSSALLQTLSSFTDNARRLGVTTHRRLAIALNRDQIPSKLWLIDRLSDAMPLQDRRILVVGGWYGILPLLLQCLYPAWRIRTDVIDVDPAACEVASILLEGLVENLTITCKDAIDVDYREVVQEPHSVVVNTVCEHMSNFLDWFSLIQPGQLIALQSNDHVGCSEHTNCVPSLETFEAQAPLSEVYFRGILPLANFRRFMLIGRR